LEKVELHDQIKRRQFQLMHEEWKREVYNKLNSPIVEKVKAMDSKELNRTRVETYQRFLDVSNKKGSLFRDIIIESEYNPLNDVKPLSFHTLVDDPIKRVIRRREEEVCMLRLRSIFYLKLTCFYNNRMQSHEKVARSQVMEMMIQRA
jgi:hypothetical protein